MIQCIANAGEIGIGIAHLESQNSSAYSAISYRRLIFYPARKLQMLLIDEMYFFKCIFFFKQIKACQRSRTANRVGRVGMSVKKSVRFIVAYKRIVNKLFAS